MNEPARKCWFPAKRYGWGWGLPVTWQGWVVLILWTLVVVVVAPFAGPNKHPLLFALFMAVMLAILVAICYAKGEPPRWRWGGRDESRRR